jgi:ring-1,2-phenylacetyl-CoA epoxidase subunit PaaE
VSRVFHPLPVSTVETLTADAVAITFAVPPDLRPTFEFQPGQHVTIRSSVDGGRRSYSICSTPAELRTAGTFAIGVKRVAGGVFSTQAATSLAPGDTLDVLPPAGRFTTALDPARDRHYAAVVAGSGITPVLSLVATALATEPRSRFTVVYGNRSAGTTMFADDLADLKDRYPARLHLVYVFSREAQLSPLLSGRLDPARLRELFAHGLPDPSTVDEWFLCGPYGLVTGAREVLGDSAVVHSELFHVSDPAPPAVVEPAGADVALTVVLDGRSTSTRMGRSERVLDAALRVRGELPYACRGGVCSTCRARLVSGKVTMARTYALEPDEIAAGYVLTCQASPTTDDLHVDYDA